MARTDADASRSDHETRSASALHVKTFAVDRQRIFVGSSNLDPRSARLNTEMGVVVGSAPLASRLARVFDEDLPRLAYEVHPRAAGQGVEWGEPTPTGSVTPDPTPGALRRGWVGFLSILPIEWLL